MGQNHCHIGRDACVRNRTATTPKCFEPLRLSVDPSCNGSALGVRRAAVRPTTLSQCPSFRRPREYGYSDTRTKPALNHANIDLTNHIHLIDLRVRTSHLMESIGSPTVESRKSPRRRHGLSDRIRRHHSPIPAPDSARAKFMEFGAVFAAGALTTDRSGTTHPAGETALHGTIGTSPESSRAHGRHVHHARHACRCRKCMARIRAGAAETQNIPRRRRRAIGLLPAAQIAHAVSPWGPIATAHRNGQGIDVHRDLPALFTTLRRSGQTPANVRPSVNSFSGQPLPSLKKSYFRAGPGADS
jgi:hypothetical protein